MRNVTPLWLVLCCMPCLAWAQAPSPQALATTKANLAKTQAEEARLKREVEAAEHALDGLRSRATSLAARIQSAEAALTQAETTLRRTEADLRKASTEYEARKSAYADTITALLKLRELPATAIFVEPEALDDTMRTAAALEVASHALEKRARSLKASVEKLEALKESALAQRRAVTEKQVALAREDTQLQRDLEARQATQRQLQRDFAQTSARSQALAKSSADLQQLIAKLEQDRRAQQLAKLKAKETPPIPASRSYIKPMTGAQGNFKAPVAGRVLHRFGERKNANESWRGMVFAARAGGTVTTPYDGEVVFTGPFRDYGNMVLLRHANGYISLLAGMANIQVNQGQRLRKGEPMGRMGGGSAGTGVSQLYVELRRNTKPIDPTQWFANLGKQLAGNTRP